MRSMQVLEEEVHPGMCFRAVLRLGARSGSFRSGSQSFRGEQRFKAAAEHPSPQAARRCRGDMLRGASSPSRPCLWMRRPHLRSPATGNKSIYKNQSNPSPGGNHGFLFQVVDFLSIVEGRDDQV